MKIIQLIGLCLPLTVAGLQADPVPDRDWPSFRGVQARGTSVKSAPVEWDVASGKNVQWKTPIPGLGHASPVIWNDKVFILTAVNETGDADLKIGLYGDIGAAKDQGPQRWMLHCLDKATGKIIWKETITQGIPKVKRHTKASHANSTPATDGKHVICLVGAEGIFCFSMEGKLIWKKDLGQLNSGYFVVPSAEWGFGSSPVITKDKVIIQCDVQTNSFVAALDVETGRELWKTPRLEVPTWSTPTIIPEKNLVVLNGFKHAGGYDLETGKEIWKLKGGGDIPVPTPVVADGKVFLTSAHGMLAPIYAIDLNAQGDISLPSGVTTNSHIPWSYPRKGIYMQTPIALGKQIYFCNDAGALSTYDIATGKLIYAHRVGMGGSGFTASPVAAADHIYITAEDGTVYVVKAGELFGEVSKNSLGESCLATPAVSEGRLYFRTRGHVVAIGH